MAEIDDVADGALKDIALRVPANVRINMSGLELRLRCEYVHDLQSRAQNEPPEKAERTRKLAEKVIHSLSDYSYSKAQMELSGQLMDAQRRQDSQAAAEAYMGLNSLAHREPRLPEKRLAAEASALMARGFDQAVVPPVPREHLFNRRGKRR